ncbi:SPOR domain-containing protein [Bacillus sp. FSL K6-3431]|uniref:SPOR domain-containing protein n=1 Tax=Bacillus sp. FSL K6-3431 TaxID=2921500 RepID=UPI0030F4DF3A
MDKKHKTQQPAIKIKINGEERPFEEEVIVNNWQTAVEETSAAADKTLEEENFDWVLPEVEYNEVSEFQKVNYFPSKNKKYTSRGRKSAPLATLILSIFLAVAVGLLLGTFLLKMVMNPDDQAAALDDSSITAPIVLKEETNKLAEVPYTAELPAFTAAVIQGDVFSNKEAADNRASEYDAQGYASTIMEKDGKHYVFIGIASAIGEAKAWEANLKENGLNVWAKELQIGSVKIPFTSKEEATLFASEGKLFQLLANEAISGMNTGKVNDANITAIGKTLEMKEETRSKEGVAFELYNKLYGSYEGLKGFQSNNGDKALLKKVQQNLLDYIKLYEGARR